MKILFLSTIISLAFSTSAPAGGYLGCNNVATTPCGTGGTCDSKTGTCTCSTVLYGFKCASTIVLTDVVLNADTITAIGVTGEAFGTATLAAITTVAANGISVTAWKMLAGATAPAFTNFVFSMASARTISLPFLSQTMVNL